MSMDDNQRIKATRDYFRAVHAGDYQTAAGLLSEMVVAGESVMAGEALAMTCQLGGVSVTQTMSTVERGASVVGIRIRNDRG
jgi:hypothetical protein